MTLHSAPIAAAVVPHLPLVAGHPDDFDFLHGHWHVDHRRLVQRLAGCDTWESFTGETAAHPVLAGFGNVDDNRLDAPSGPYHALSLRSFDPATRQWSIWWLDGRRPGALDVPVVGGFAGGIGTFLADDQLDGRPIRVRFLWTGTTTGQPCWEQAFSADGGRQWETNWIMRFSRRSGRR